MPGRRSGDEVGAAYLRSVGFGLERTLTEVLSSWQEEGRISAIDEGRIWHVCPHPSYAEEF